MVGNDGLLYDEIPEGGNIYLHSTQRTRKMWKSFRDKHSKLISSLPQEISPKEISSGKEMNILHECLQSTKWSFFPKEKFVSGQWYEDEFFRNSADPVVIQNNFLIGTPAKIERAKKWNHWYLGSNGKCRTNINFIPSDEWPSQKSSRKLDKTFIVVVYVFLSCLVFVQVRLCWKKYMMVEEI